MTAWELVSNSSIRAVWIDFLIILRNRIVTVRILVRILSV
jgi:hypothetical protein